MDTKKRNGMADSIEPWAPHASALDRALVAIFVGAPFAAVIAAAIVLWDVGIGIRDVVIAAIMYVLTAVGIGVGYHRLFTHQAFKAVRVLRVVLACLGTMAIEGDVVSWAADHRRHHQYSDMPGDPHSPWRFGDDAYALLRGMLWAHIGWIFRNETTNKVHYAPDLLRDGDMVTVTRWQPALVLTSLGLPALAGGLLAWSWVGALTGLFWGGLVRVGLLQHVTWSINSICHAFGDRPYRSRDRSGNVWWLAIPSGGEAWHNYHHADPTSARHGVLRMQLDSAARIIWLLERVGWAYDVRWPDQRRIRARLKYEAVGAK